MGLRIGPSMLSTKEQRRQRDEQRNGSHKCIQEWEKDQLGCLPTQMTSQFSPLSKTHKSAVTTRTGCQGDTLCLSIKGAACEDYPDLENKQRERRHPSGQNKKNKKNPSKTEKSAHSDRDLTRSTGGSVSQNPVWDAGMEPGTLTGTD